MQVAGATIHETARCACIAPPERRRVAPKAARILFFETHAGVLMGGIGDSVQ